MLGHGYLHMGHIPLIIVLCKNHILETLFIVLSTRKNLRISTRLTLDPNSILICHPVGWIERQLIWLFLKLQPTNCIIPCNGNACEEIFLLRITERYFGLYANYSKPQVVSWVCLGESIMHFDWISCAVKSKYVGSCFFLSIINKPSSRTVEVNAG